MTLWSLDLPAALHFVPLDATGSTNAVAKALAEQGAPHLTFVAAKRQSSGRGRYGRTWVTGDGDVACSILVRPETKSLGDVGSLSFVAGLAVRDALADLTDAAGRLHLKWPNDALLDGRKVAGILLESSSASGRAGEWRVGWVVVGIGVNVANAPSEGIVYPATSLASAGFAHLERDRVIEALARSFVTRYEQWRAGGYAAIRADVESAMSGIGARVAVRKTPDGPASAGIFLGLDGEGRLLLGKEDGGIETCLVGDVFKPDRGDASEGDEQE